MLYNRHLSLTWILQLLPWANQTRLLSSLEWCLPVFQNIQLWLSILTLFPTLIITTLIESFIGYVMSFYLGFTVNYIFVLLHHNTIMRFQVSLVVGLYHFILWCSSINQCRISYNLSVHPFVSSLLFSPTYYKMTFCSLSCQNHQLSSSKWVILHLKVIFLISASN